MVDDSYSAFHKSIGDEGWDTNPTGTMVVNLQLNAGQVIKVQNALSTRVFGTTSIGTMRSWFTGHMLYLL